MIKTIDGSSMMRWSFALAVGVAVLIIYLIADQNLNIAPSFQVIKQIFVSKSVGSLLNSTAFSTTVALHLTNSEGRNITTTTIPSGAIVPTTSPFIASTTTTSTSTTSTTTTSSSTTSSTSTSPIPTLQSTTSLQPLDLSHGNLLSVDLLSASAGLGNHIFRFAGALGIANLTGRTFVTPNTDGNWMVRKWFKITIRQLTQNVTWKLVGEPCFSCWKPSVYFAVNKSVPMQIAGQFLSYHNFHFIRDEVRNQLQFQDAIREAAELKLKKVRAQHCLNASCLIIGIHIRRGDFLGDDSIRHGRKVANVSYLLSAMAYYHKQHPNRKLVFAVLGNDYEWNNETFSHINETAAVLNPFSTEEDMCLLSLCDHMIMTVGTYGWWASYLGKGSVTYLADYYSKNTELDRLINGKRNHFPPEWIPL